MSSAAILSGQLARNSFATALVRALSGASRLCLIWVARHLAAEDFGRIALVMAFVEIFRVLADAGVSLVSIRQLAVETTRTEQWVDSCLGLNLVTSTIALALMHVVFFTMYGHAENLLVVAGLAIYGWTLSGSLMSYFQSRLLMQQIVFGSVLGALVTALWFVWSIYAHWPLPVLMGAIPAGAGVELLCMAIVYRWRFAPLHCNFDWRRMRQLMRQGLPVVVGGMVVVMYSRADHVFIWRFLGAQELGEYAAAYRLTEPFLLVLSSFSLSLYASLSPLWNSVHADTVPREFFRVVRWPLLAALIVALFLALFALPLAHFMYPHYVHTGTVLWVLAGTIFFKGLNAQLTAVIQSTGRYSAVTWICVANLSINGLLHVWWVPLHGIIGAALAVLCTEGLNTVFQSTYVWQLFHTRAKCSGIAGVTA